MTINKSILSLVDDLRAKGMSDDQIIDDINDREFEAKQHREEMQQIFGDEFEDERSTHEKVMCDRLDMGRNEAGEWIGFC